jgi:hypothetical protein
LQTARGNGFLQDVHIFGRRKIPLYKYKEYRILGLSMYVLKIVNKHILQTGMQLYLILSCNFLSIVHHTARSGDNSKMTAKFDIL